jgi:5-deoxy-glucuronate isomerase
MTALSWANLRVLALDGPTELTTGADEMLLLPLAGSCQVICGDQVLELAGRASVFSGPTDFAYLPRNTTVQVEGTGRFALPSAPAARDLPLRYGSAQDVAVELRGAGACSRQVSSICMEDSFEADKLLVCEVITPAGNWSSYPPHKHDQDRPGESVLEEIYYFEIGGPAGSGLGYMRAYRSDDRPIDVLTEVRTGDVVLVPYGWHGPAMAVPGYDMYYLNVMAGPGERRWLICDDPVHGWVRDTWASEPVDPRLPFYRAANSSTAHHRGPA